MDLEEGNKKASFDLGRIWRKLDDEIKEGTERDPSKLVLLKKKVDAKKLQIITMAQEFYISKII